MYKKAEKLFKNLNGEKLAKSFLFVLNKIGPNLLHTSTVCTGSGTFLPVNTPLPCFAGGLLVLALLDLLLGAGVAGDDVAEGAAGAVFVRVAALLLTVPMVAA